MATDHERAQTASAHGVEDLTAAGRRRLAAAFFTGGFSRAEVVRAMGVSRETADVWARRFRAGGLDALLRPGRPARRARLAGRVAGERPLTLEELPEQGGTILPFRRRSSR